MPEDDRVEFSHDIGILVPALSLTITMLISLTKHVIPVAD